MRALLVVSLVSFVSCASTGATDSLHTNGSEPAPFETAPSESVREVPLDSRVLCQELGLGYPIDPLRCDAEE
jgi:hypothetical protein